MRDAAKAQHLADLGVRVRRGSYDDPAALRDSFADADQVLLVSSERPGRRPGPLHRAAIEAAVAAGAKRILYTSHQNADPASPFRPARFHAAAEAALAGSGVAWTSLRNGFYAHSLDWLLGPWQADRRDRRPRRRPGLLDRPGRRGRGGRRHPGRRPPSTARSRSPPATRSPSTTSPRIASELTGRPSSGSCWTTSSGSPTQIAHGSPEDLARMLLGFFQAARRGDFAATDPTLAGLLGRTPRTVTDLLRERAGD